MTNYDKLAADLPDVAEQPPAAPVLYTVADTDPDAEAGLRTLSKSTGIPVEALRLKPQADEARRIDAANKHDGILSASPKTAGFLQDPIAAAVSHDDVENMGFMERTLRGLSGGFQEGVGMAASGTGVLADIAQRRFVGTFSSLFLPQARQGQGKPTTESLAGPLIGEGWRQTGGMTKDFARQQTMVPQSQQAFYDKVLGGVGQVGAQVVMAPFTRGAGLYAQGADAMDEKLKNDSVTAGQYDTAVLAGAAVTGITEKWALDKLLGPLDTKIKSAALATLARIGMASAAEGVQEFSENAIQDIIREVVVNDALNKPVAYLGESINLGQSVEEGEIGAAVGGVIRSMVEAGLHIKARGKGAQSAEDGAKLIEQLNKGAAASKVLARDPETFQSFIRSASEGGPVTDVYIDANVLNQSGLAEQVLAASPAAAEQYQEALATGGQVRIPIDEYAARIAPQEYAQQLLDDLRLQPEDMSRREAQEYAQSGAMQDLEAAVAAVVGNKTQDDTFTASRDRVRQQVLDNLNALGRFTPQKNELDATLIAARSATRAAQLGVTPEQFFNDYLLKVTAGGVGGEVLNQFAGQNAETADLSALDKAKQRIAAGEDAEAVRKDTGWHTGVDGKWRFEIDDSKAALKMRQVSMEDMKAVNGDWIKKDDFLAAHESTDEAKSMRLTASARSKNKSDMPALDQVLSHDSLFSAYPWLRSIKVHVDDSVPIGEASFAPSVGVIVVSPMSDSEMLPVLLHEIQHAIQENEGFAEGGSPESIAQKYSAARSRLYFLEQDPDYIAGQKEIDDLWSAAFSGEGIDEKEIASREAEIAARHPALVEARAVMDVLRKSDEYGYDSYRRLAGEVEARNTQARANLNDAERNATSPQSTADVAERDQIVQRSGGTAYQMPQPFTAPTIEIDGITRPTTNSAGNPIHSTEAGIRNFWKWFGDSKIVDEQGRPLVVYHGSRSTEALTDFVVSQNEPSDTRLKRTKDGAYFTRNPDKAAVYAGQDGSTYPVYLKISNPKMIADAFGSVEVDAAQLKVEGFDGLWNPKGFPSDEIVAIDKNQIKSAMANSGEFSPKSDNILYQSDAAGQSQLEEQLAIADRMIAERGGLFAPNGQPSKLNRRQWAQVRTANFKAWFGDWEKGAAKASKVVDDATKEPLVVFHGTGGDFDAFDRKKGGEASGNSAGKNGHFFSGSTAIASDYALRAKSDPNVMPAFLALPNPTRRKFRDIDQLDYWASINDFSGGLIADLGDGQQVFMVKDGNQIKSATGNAGTFSPKTDSILNQVKRGSFSPATNTIALLKNADLSTFLHETGHFFFETDIAVAGQILRENGAFGIDTMTPGQQQILRDVSALLKWHGIEGDIASQIDQWDRMDFEERRGYHEKTAESFERYLMEGKAPSIELQPVFQTFRQWLISVYKSIKDFLKRNPDAGELSDEVRAVFDRMLATEEEIRLAEQARSMLPLFADAVNAGMTPSEFAEYQKLGNEATRAAIDELQAKGVRDMKWLSNARSRMLKKLQAQAKAQRAEVRAQVRMEVLQEPVYQAWNLLTAKMTAEDQLSANKPKRSASVDPTSDSLFEAIAKMGGLNKATLVSQWGIDPKDKADSGLFGKPVMRAKDGGASVDSMVEALTEEGYLTPDENGKGDVAELEEKFQAELRGDKQYSRIKDYEPDALAGQGEDVSGVTAARIDRASLDDMEGLSSWIIGRLEALGMTARTGGMHPDVLSEVMPGWTSGDEMVRAIVAARPLKEEIEARTDQRMIEQYSELATPEALEQAADMAIHNDARERFLATEYNALAKAAGERKMLLEAARAFARQLIGRQRIRDIRPGQYTAAETRAAKAVMVAKDMAQKAAEKRNQILSGMAAREAYRAKEDVDKGLRYLKKFESPTIRKRISGDYVDQIEKLLEAIDLRKRSLTDIDRRKSFGAFVRSQIEKGIVPVMSDSLLPPNLRAAYVAKVMERNADGELVIKDDVEQAKVLADFLDMAETRPYKEMTVEEFRGLIDTIRQIEHLGRKKKSLLTARDGKTYEQKRDELAASVAANSEKLPSRLNRTIPSKMAERLSGLRDFKMSLRKVGMLMRLLDGNKDGGPMWDFFVRSANERGDWETEEIAKSSEVLTKALRPLFKMKGKMRGKGIYFESLGRSLNREQRIGLALNVGNEGNLQRLLDGEGWAYADIKPVLESLTEAEWAAVQEVWDHMDSYRPMIAAIEKRTVGAEPEWVQPMQFMVQTADGKTLTLKGGYYPVKYDTEASARSEQLQDATDAKAAMDAAYGSSTTHRSFVKKRSEMVVGRPLELSLSGMYSGVQDVIHDLAWREWLLDASKMAESKTLDAVIRDKHGAETVRAIKDWIKDIAAGTKKPRGKMDRAIGFMRRNVAAAGLAINFMNAVQNVTGIQNSIERVGARWIAVGQKEFLSDIKGASAWVSEKSSLMRNRARTQFRDLNELRNIVENGDGIVTKARANQFILMTTTQRVVDMPTWIGAYRKAEADGAVVQYEDGSIDDSKAIAMADQAVIDAQGSGMTKDLSGIERGSEAEKLFTVYYSYMNTTYNLGANRIAGARGGNAKERGSAAFHILTLMMVPVIAMDILKAALTPGDDDDWDDPEKLAKNLGNSQMSYLFGMVPLLREFYPMVQPFVADQSFGYQGPSGMRMASDAAKFGQQAAQGDFDDGFRKAAVSLSGPLMGMPAAQINRTWTGVEAIADDKTVNPAALLFGYQEPR